MAEALRPMSTGELLDRTFALYKRNFLLFAGIVLPGPMIMLVVQLIQLPFAKQLMTSAQNPQILMANLGRFFWWWGISIFVWTIGMSITHAATVRAVSAVHLSRPITVGESYSGLRGKFLRVILIVICILLGFVGAWAVFGGAAALITGIAVAAGWTAGLLGKIAGVAVGVVALLSAAVLVVWFMARYALAIQACVVENTKIFQSLKRSAVLAKRSIMRIIVVYVLFVVINLVIALTFTSVVRLVTLPFHSYELTGVLQALVSFLAGVLVGPLATVAMSLVYYDERVRKEGFDLELMMTALNRTASTSAASA